MKLFTDFKKVLSEKYLVNVLNIETSSSSFPTVTLEFTEEASRKIATLLNRPGKDWFFYITKASNFAKMSSRLPVFVPDIEIHYTSDNPLQIELQGSLILIECFVFVLLSDPSAE